MHIVHIASELAPLAKVGGLADVVLGLCRELSWKGHDVDIIIPKYDCLDSEVIRDLAIDIKDLHILLPKRMVFQYGLGGVGGKYKSLFHRTSSSPLFFQSWMLLWL